MHRTSRSGFLVAGGCVVAAVLALVPIEACTGGAGSPYCGSLDASCDEAASSVSSGDAAGPCGGFGQPCCTVGADACQAGHCCDTKANRCVGYGQACSDPSSVCSVGKCQSCGAVGQACCSVGSSGCGQGCCDVTSQDAVTFAMGLCVGAGQSCTSSTNAQLVCSPSAVGGCTACGRYLDPCCEDNACAPTLACTGGTCQ